MTRAAALVALALAAILIPGGTPAVAQEPANPNVVYPTVTENIRSGYFQEFTFHVPCPAGTVALGGGWSAFYPVVGVWASAPASNGWRITGSNSAEGDQPEPVHGYGSCASGEAFPAGSIEYPKGVAVRLKPWPYTPYKERLQVTCPGGSVPVSGGYVAENEAVEAGSSFPTWASEGNNTGNTWVAGGENFENTFDPGHYQSWDFSAYATCVKSELAFGVFEMNAVSASQSVDEPAVTTASCTTGDVISGGFEALESDGTEPNYTGDLESMYFSLPQNGYSVRYASSHFDHHLMRVYAICANVVPATASLTQADFDAACQAAMPGQSGVHAVSGQLATDWRCAGEGGSSTPIPGNQGAWTCEALGQVDPTATYLRRGDPFSWSCYGLPSGAQPASKVKGQASFDASTGGAQVRVTGRSGVRRPVGNLGRARVTVPATLLEASGAGDLLKNGKRSPVHPVVLKPRGRRGHDFVYAGGSKLRLTLRLRLSQNKKAYLFDLRAHGGWLAKPRLCDSGPRATTHLTTHLVIDGGAKVPTNIMARSFWRCGKGTLKTARPALRLH
jgi:hypothetical protein